MLALTLQQWLTTSLIAGLRTKMGTNFTILSLNFNHTCLPFCKFVKFKIRRSETISPAEILLVVAVLIWMLLVVVVFGIVIWMLVVVVAVVIWILLVVVVFGIVIWMLLLVVVAVVICMLLLVVVVVICMLLLVVVVVICMLLLLLLLAVSTINFSCFNFMTLFNFELFMSIHFLWDVQSWHSNDVYFQRQFRLKMRAFLIFLFVQFLSHKKRRRHWTLNSNHHSRRQTRWPRPYLSKCKRYKRKVWIFYLKECFCSFKFGNLKPHTIRILQNNVSRKQFWHLQQIWLNLISYTFQEYNFNLNTPLVVVEE